MVVVRKEKHWLDSFDLTNKHFAKDWKSEWLNQFDFSGDTGWGNSKVDHGLGNERGENSHIYGSWDNEGLGINRPGAGAGFKSIQTEINRMANFMRGFRLGRGTIKHSTTLYDEFKPKTQFELDSIRQDSIFMNEVLYDREKYIHNVVPIKWGGYNSNKEPIILFGFRDRSYKRKDSTRVNKVSKYNLKRAFDSILKK